MNGRSIHVMHIVPGLVPGGMEMTMARVIRGLIARGIRHSVVCLTGEPVIRDEIPASVDVHCLHSKPNEPQLPFRLWGLIRRIRPSVIHARNWGAWPDVALARLAMLPNVPLIFSFHGFANPGHVPLRRRVAFHILSRITTGLFTVSEAARKMLVKEMGWPANRAQVIPNGVDIERFAPAEKTPDDCDRLIIGTVGSLTPVKNQTLLLRACAELVNSGIDCEVRIAGEGPERPGLKELAARLDLSDRVHLPGYVGDVPGFLRQIDVFVLPSLSEAHPNALIEAMASGLPCVGAAVGGMVEVLADGRLGRLVPNGDAHVLAGALRELAKNQALRRDLGAKARERVVERYSMDRMLDNYEALYRAPVTRAWRSAATPRHPRVLMLGPLPPLTGGMATVTDNLRQSTLARRCRLMVMSNAKTTPEDRSPLAGIRAQLQLFGRVLRRALNRRPQIVHFQTCALFTFWRDILHMATVRALGCRVIWHIHDGTFESFLRDQPPVRKLLLRTFLRLADRTIVLSRQTMDRLKALAPEVRWQVISNGVPMPPPRQGPKTEAIQVLFLGELTRRKGAWDLVDATALAARKGFDGTILLAGDERVPGERDELIRHIEEKQCASRVRLLGLIGGSEKEAALTQGNCLALPSYAEGLPMAILEGMAYGMPVIATNVGAIPEVVDDGKEGFLIEPGDVETLADHLLQLWKDPERCRHMGQAARRKVEAEYSVDAMVDRIMSIYDEILHGAAPRS